MLRRGGRSNCSRVGDRCRLARVETQEFARTSGKADHWILRSAVSDGARVEGTALEVTDAELERADKYEPVEYKRVLAMLASGRQTWVFVGARVRSPAGEA